MTSRLVRAGERASMLAKMLRARAPTCEQAQGLSTLPLARASRRAGTLPFARVSPAWSSWAAGARGGRGGARCYGASGAVDETQDADKRDIGAERSGRSYEADAIQVLEGLEPVRKRPGMYIGSTGRKGLHHLVYEVLDNAIDEVQAGHASKITVEVETDTGRVTVADNGRGIPVDVHPKTGKSALETVLTVLHAGGKFNSENGAYVTSGGLHGVGLSVVNALSSELHVWVSRGGERYAQSYVRGVPTGEVERSRGLKGAKGTTVSFRPDADIFTQTTSFDMDVINARLRELAFLNPRAAISFRAAPSDCDDEEGKHAWHHHQYSGGLEQYISVLTHGKKHMHKPMILSKVTDGIYVELALQWSADAFSDSIVSYVNNVKTVDGGTHVDGLKTALTRVMNASARKYKLLKEDMSNMPGEYIRDGLTCILHVKIQQPEFEGQTKAKLGSTEATRAVSSCVGEGLSSSLDMHPEVLNRVISKCLQAQRAAEAARKAREVVRRKSVLKSLTLPGKLADCTSKNLEETELFIVEGDSAGGSTKQARDRAFQAVLPLRGKILNIEKTDDSALYKNQELSNLIVGLGLGTTRGSKHNLRYGRVVILTDADVDGSHIQTLLLTFLFRYAPVLFEEGRVYVGIPPLYKLSPKRGKAEMYCYSEAELEAAMGGRPAGDFNVQRFKGLGEMMPEQLWQTTLDPGSRTLKRLTVEDAALASETLSILMGSEVGPRKELIFRESAQFVIDDLDI